MTRIVLVPLLLVLVSALGACNDDTPKPAPTAKAGAPAGGAAFPPSLFLASAPADVKEIKAAKPALKPGDTIALKGRIGGGEEPFVDGRAMFTLVDAAVPACSDDPADKCKTPWDYCCVAHDELAANSVIVRVVGPDGRPVKSSLLNVHGLKPLAKVTAVGKVAEADGALVLDAVGLYVAP